MLWATVLVATSTPKIVLVATSRRQPRQGASTTSRDRLRSVTMDAHNFMENIITSVNNLFFE